MWFQQRGQDIVLECVILPKSSRTQIVGVHGNPERLKIKVAAPPVEGAANDALIHFLAKTLKIPKNRFEILSGQTNKYKEILVSKISANEILHLIDPAWTGIAKHSDNDINNA